MSASEAFDGIPFLDHSVDFCTEFPAIEEDQRGRFATAKDDATRAAGFPVEIQQVVYFERCGMRMTRIYWSRQ